MKHTTTTLGVVSGKGGVGKSVLAVNLAESLARSDHVVALIDADIGQADCPVLLNESPEHTVLDYSRRAAELEDVLHRTTSGMSLAVGAVDRVRSDEEQQELYSSLDEVIARLRRTHEFVVIDGPAGTGPTVRWTLDRANAGILVLVGEPTAIADSYRVARMTWEQEPNYPLNAVVNFADGKADAYSIAERFAQITDQFTGKEPEYLGAIPFSRDVRDSVIEQQPVVRFDGPAAEAFESLTETLLEGRQTTRKTATALS